MRFFVAVILFASTLSAQSVGAFSPVPMWPSSGTPTPAQRRGSYVFFDPLAQDYVLYYPEELGTAKRRSGRMALVRIQLQNRSIPSIRVSMTREASGKYRYTYALANGAQAKSPINSWALATAATDDWVQLSHNRWKSTADTIHKPAVAPQSLDLGSELRKSATMGKFVRWWAPRNHPIAANSREAGFVAVSDHRPGWTLAYIAAGDGISVASTLPKAVFDQLEEIQKPEYYYIPLVTIGPKYGPNETDPSIAADWSLYVKKMTARKVLSAGSPVVKEVARILQSITNGVRTAGLGLTETPKTRAEKELADGVRLSLGLK